MRSLESNGDAKISTLKAVAYALGTTPADLFAPEDGDPHVSAGEVLGAAAKLRTDTEEALADGVIDAAERERLRSDSDAVTEAAERYSQSITLGHR